MPCKVGSLHSSRRRLRSWVLLLAGLALVGLMSPAHSRDTPNHDLDPLVQDLCQRRIVLLGEDSGHGAGTTLAVKSELVRRLVDQCRFQAVAFESPVYDFLDYEARIASSTATPAHLSDALGGLWSTTAEIEPLIEYLHKRARNDEISLLGLDIQLAGATQAYAQRTLPTALAAALPHGTQRDACAAEIGRLTRWDYDAAHPNTKETAERLGQCATTIHTAASEQGDARTAWMAHNLQEYLRMQAGNLDARDRAMQANLEWHLARKPAMEKVIVWVGAIHAGRAPLHDEPDRKRLGTLLASSGKSQMASIAFTAVAGDHGRQGKTPLALPAPEPGALEDVFAPPPGRHYRYVPREELAQAGTSAGRAIRYSRAQTEDWSELFDGIVVLDFERPPTFLREPAPLQPD